MIGKPSSPWWKWLQRTRPLRAARSKIMLLETAGIAAAHYLKTKDPAHLALAKEFAAHAAGLSTHPKSVPRGTV